MSESIASVAPEPEAPPLDPSIASEQVEETSPEEKQEEQVEEKGKAETSADWQKQLQKMQQKQANFQKQVLATLQELKSSKSAPTQEEVDEVEELLKRNDPDQYSPGTSAILRALNKRIDKALAAGKQLPAIQDQVRAAEFAEYMADKPEGFREAYAQAQRDIQEAEEANGREVSERELQLAMGVWAKNWLKDNAAPKGGKGAEARSARKPVVPAPESRTPSRVIDITDMSDTLSASRVPDGKGGTRLGNKLGL